MTPVTGVFLLLSFYSYLTLISEDRTIGKLPSLPSSVILFQAGLHYVRF